MSHVDNFILLLGSGEDLRNVQRVNDVLLESAGGVAFSRVDEHSGGHKRMEARVFLYAGNYQRVEEVSAALRSIEWEDPDDVQLLHNGQHDCKWEFVDWRGRQMPKRETMSVVYSREQTASMSREDLEDACVGLSSDVVFHDEKIVELKAQVSMWRSDLLACMKDRDQIYLDRDKRLEEAQAASRELKTRVKSWQERAIELEEQRDAVLAEYIARLEGAQAANRKLNERLQEALMQLGGEP